MKHLHLLEFGDSPEILRISSPPGKSLFSRIFAIQEPDSCFFGHLYIFQWFNAFRHRRTRRNYYFSRICRTLEQEICNTFRFFRFPQHFTHFTAGRIGRILKNFRPRHPVTKWAQWGPGPLKVLALFAPILVPLWPPFSQNGLPKWLQKNPKCVQ